MIISDFSHNRIFFFNKQLQAVRALPGEMDMHAVHTNPGMRQSQILLPPKQASHSCLPRFAALISAANRVRQPVCSYHFITDARGYSIKQYITTNAEKHNWDKFAYMCAGLWLWTLWSKIINQYTFQRHAKRKTVPFLVLKEPVCTRMSSYTMIIWVQMEGQ